LPPSATTPAPICSTPPHTQHIESAQKNVTHHEEDDKEEKKKKEDDDDDDNDDDRGENEAQHDEEAKKEKKEGEEEAYGWATVVRWPTEQRTRSARRRPTCRADMTLSAHNPNNCGIVFEHFSLRGWTKRRWPHAQDREAPPKQQTTPPTTAATAAKAARSTVWRQRMKKMLEKWHNTRAFITSHAKQEKQRRQRKENTPVIPVIPSNPRVIPGNPE
jgi:hypothetical protein